MSFDQDILAPIIVALVISAIVGLWMLFFRPMRNKLDPVILRKTGDHGIKILTYGTPHEMGGLRPEEMLNVDPGWLEDSDFYFANGIPGDGPRAKNEWGDWSRGHGGEGVGWRHILVRIQATQDRTVLVLKPQVNVSRSEVAGGLVLSPAKELGGNGLMVRQFVIDLDATPPLVEFYSEGSSETPQFVMRKGDSEAFVVIVHASHGRHEWTLDIPVLVDGETFYPRVDDHRHEFVTVGGSSAEGRWWDFNTREWRPAEW